MSGDETMVTTVALEGTKWFDDPSEEENGFQVESYDITASPNDFNILTIHSFIESGAIKIPNFQRNYVWDIKRASKLIESILIGLPVPQVFLYEEGRNSFLVIDGQQRLLSIYYFMKMRFPKTEKRTELRQIFDQNGKIPDHILHDDTYFTKFKLQLSDFPDGGRNKFKGMNYETLNEYKTQFDLRVIRNIIVKQNTPEDGDSSVFEIFNRLNTGGINLTPQEIRSSLYHCEFFNMLHRLNGNSEWRKLLGFESPDIHMKDHEIMLRSFAFLLMYNDYKPSLTKFVNLFSTRTKTMPTSKIGSLESIFIKFMEACQSLPDDIFRKKNNRFNVLLYEAVFTATCHPLLDDPTLNVNLSKERIEELVNSHDFLAASQEGTTSKENVLSRISTAISIFE